MFVAGYSTGHPSRTQVGRWISSGDDSTVSLESPVPLARLKIRQKLWYPAQSGVEGALPVLGSQEIWATICVRGGSGVQLLRSVICL